MTKQPKAISLFAGAGGCSFGFKQDGYDIIYATDFDKAAIETYKRNFPETKAECADTFPHHTHFLNKLNQDVILPAPLLLNQSTVSFPIF